MALSSTYFLSAPLEHPEKHARGLKVFEYLLSLSTASDLNFINTEGRCALHVTATQGLAHCMLQLLAAGADANTLDCNRKSAMHLAAMHGFYECVEILLSSGGMVSEGDDNSLTPLHHAVSGVHLNMIHLLLQHGSDIHALDSDGSSVLHIIGRNFDREDGEDSDGSAEAERERSERLRAGYIFLLAAGCELALVNATGRTALHEACQRGQSAGVAVLRAVGADVNAIDSHGDTPLTIACAYGSSESVLALLEVSPNVESVGVVGVVAPPLLLPADPGVCDAQGSYPIHIASRGNGDHVRCIRALVASGRVDVNMQEDNEVGNTPLMVAVRNNSASGIKVLRELGADVSPTNKRGEGPLLVATQLVRRQCISALMD
jgi:ankyrin repeat protein